LYLEFDNEASVTQTLVAPLWRGRRLGAPSPIRPDASTTRCCRTRTLRWR